MADSHLQLNHDASTEMRPTRRWPDNKVEQQAIIINLFKRDGWDITKIINIKGSHWEIVTQCQEDIKKIDLYIGSIRDESRQEDEYKMQLGNNYPSVDRDGWITLILGIYVILENEEEPEYLIACYNRSRAKYTYEGNPSHRGVRTKGLKRAKMYGFYENEQCCIFKPDMVYYCIENLDISKKSYFGRTHSSETTHNPIVYSNYFSALRTKPFMLLAGISGTGKSRIVRKFAQASVTEELQRLYDPKSIEDGFERWELHKPANFELIQVKPNWHNSLEVVGYKSNIGGAHYEFTPFVEFVVRAWKHPEVPFFLCLDEMNLAPVEQYFAEFLSAIESRSMEKGEYETDPIIKPFREFGEDVCNQMINHLLGKIDASDTTSDNPIVKLANRFKTKGLTLPKNLLVLGTVNMDETTFSFSRKVLDRAMSVVMNDVNYADFFDGKTENDMAEMDEHTKVSLIDRPICGLEAEENDASKVQAYLTAINKILDDTPFKLGYRAANEALLYVSATHEFDSSANTMAALDEFTMMKVLSRIEGDKRSIGTLLEDLQEVINESYPKSNEKLKKMAETLNNKQFVSYWT